MNNKTRSLEDRVALVTGAGSGIGSAVSQSFAENGARVMLLDVAEENGKSVENEIRSKTGIAQFYKCDVTSNDDVEQVVKEIIGKHGRIDILVNNARLMIRKTVVDLKEDEWDRVLGVNLKAVFLLSHHVIPHMVEGGGGCIVNIGSGWGLKGGEKAAAYCTAKGGVVNLTKAMAVDHGRQNIRVNCVCPGDVDTPLLQSEAEQLGCGYDDFLKQAARRPLDRVGKPEDVAQAVLYLASDAASWVTGSILVVDGGGLA